MAYFVKCFFFALVSFAEHGDCIWSVGEIVGLLSEGRKREVSTFVVDSFRLHRV